MKSHANAQRINQNPNEFLGLGFNQGTGARSLDFPPHSASLIELIRNLAEAERHTHELYQACLPLAPTLPHRLGDALRDALHEDQRHARALRQSLMRLDDDGLLEVNASVVTHASVVRACRMHGVFETLAYLEAVTVRAYSQVCMTTLNSDYRLFDVAYSNMQDNLEHLEIIGQITAQRCGHRVAGSMSETPGSP